jgi:hypothetical protein
LAVAEADGVDGRPVLVQEKDEKKKSKRKTKLWWETA